MINALRLASGLAVPSTFTSAVLVGACTSRGVTSTVKRSILPSTVRAISKSSIVRQEARIVLTRALKLLSSG